MACHATLRVLTACALLAGAAGCGGGATAAFAARYPDNLEPSVGSMVQRAAAGAQRNVPPIAAGVTANDHVYAYDLAAKRVLWDVAARSRFTPVLAGDTVIIQEGERIVGLDLRTGTARFQFDTAGMLLVGADGVADRAVVALTSGRGTGARSRLVFLQGATRVWERSLPHPVGVPALAGEVVLVPWSTQYLSGLESDTGEEFARLRLRTGVLSHALVSRGRVFVGSQHGVALLSNALAVGNLTSGPHYEPPQTELPGRPAFLNDAYAASPLPEPTSAHSRVRLTWQGNLSAGGKLQLGGDNLYLVFYRFVFALDPVTLALRWVHTHDADVVGARAEADGLVLADARGGFSYLSSVTGGPLWQVQNAPPSVDLEFPSDQTAIGGAGVVTQSQSVRAQLAAAARDPDARLVPARMLAVQLLGQLDDPTATADLLALCEDDRTTLGIRKAACNALRQRRAGNEHVLRALQRHGSYLAATTPPPVGALAKAASVQNEKRAVPLLIAHLGDPSTPTQGLAEVVQALGELGDKSAIEPLQQFLLLYHADPIDEYLTNALTQVPEALLRLQGEEARSVLTRVAVDPLGIEGPRAAATKALNKLDEQAAKAKSEGEAAQAPAAAEPPPSAPEKPKAPAHITVDIISQVLLPVHDPLQACLREAKPDLTQARIVLVIEDGQVLMVSVLPETLQACIEPLVRSQTFPVTQLSQRERVTYILKRY